MRVVSCGGLHSDDEVSTACSMTSWDSLELPSEYPSSDGEGGLVTTMETAPLLHGSGPTTAYYSILTDSHRTYVGSGEFSSEENLQKYNTKPIKPERKKQNSLVTIFSVWNTIMGSSLLTMAWGVERAGLVPALVLMVLMGGLCLYTAHVLLKVKLHHGVEGAICEVPALCRALLGRWAEVLAHVFSLLVLIGSNVIYWVLITNFLYYTFNYVADLNSSNSTEYNTTLLCPKEIANNSLLLPPDKASGSPSPYWDLHKTVPIYVAFFMYPLLNFRNASFFTKFNSLGTLSVVYLVVFVAVKGWLWGVNEVGMDRMAGRDAAVLSGMLALSFYIHNIIITIMSSNAKQENNARDLTIAFFLVTVTYALVGAIFYVCFPLAKSCIEDNMLNNFDMHDVMTAVARALLLFQVVTVYPLVAFMLRTEALLLLPVADKEGRCAVMVVNVVIVVVCILMACFSPSIGTIIRYTGALSGLVHIFALPSILQVKSLLLRGKLTFWKTIFYSLIVLFGAINLLMQFFIKE